MNALESLAASILKRIFAVRVEPPKDVRKILVIREAAIGDVLCMTPFLKALREMYPNAAIDYVVVDWAKSAIENNPNINDIFTVSNELIVGKIWAVVLKRLKFYAALAKRNYDIVFCPTTQLLYKIVLILFRKAYKIGFSTEPKGKATKYNFMLNDHVFINLNEIPRTRHIAIRNLEMLDLLSDKKIGRNYGLEVFPTSKDIKKIEDWINRLDWANKEIIAIAPSAGNAVKSDSAGKTAPKELFVDIIKELKKNPLRRFVLIGAASEYGYAESLDIADGTSVVNCCGAFSLSESAELLKRCKLLISNDSGATHLASATKTSHIVLFGATDDVEFGPYQNPNATIYRVSLPCAPCRAANCLVEPSEQLRAHARPYCLTMMDAKALVELAEQKLSAVETAMQFFQT